MDATPAKVVTAAVFSFHLVSQLPRRDDRYENQSAREGTSSPWNIHAESETLTVTDDADAHAAIVA
jgi:hypothetical protein